MRSWGDETPWGWGHRWKPAAGMTVIIWRDCGYRWKPEEFHPLHVKEEKDLEGKWSSSRANHREWCRRTGFSWRQKLPGLRMVGPITLATSLLPTHPVVAQSSSCNVCPSDSHKKVEKFPIVHGLHKRSRPTHLLHLFSFFLPPSSSLPSLRFLR